MVTAKFEMMPRDQKADAVSDAVLGDALADPHRKRRAGRETETDRDQAHEAAGCVRLKAERQRDRLHEAQAHRHVAGDLRDLLAAFLALLVELFELGNRDRQKLHDDRGVDVGRDAHRHDREVREVGARHLVDEAQERNLFDRLFDDRRIDTGRGHEAKKPVDQKHEYREQYLLSEVRDLPCVLQRLKHLRSPRLSRLPPRSFPSRWP